MNRRERRNPHYFIFNQSVSCRRITASVWAHSEGLQSDYGDGHRIIRTMAVCVCPWSFLRMSLLHYYWHAALLSNYERPSDRRNAHKLWVNHGKIRKMLSGVNADTACWGFLFKVCRPRGQHFVFSRIVARQHLLVDNVTTPSSFKKRLSPFFSESKVSLF